MLLNLTCPQCSHAFEVDPSIERTRHRQQARQGRRRTPNQKVANPVPATHILHCQLRDWLQYGFDYTPQILIPGYYVNRELAIGFCLQFKYDPAQIEQRLRSLLAFIGAPEGYRARWGKATYLPNPAELISRNDLHFEHPEHSRNYPSFLATYYPYPLAGKIHSLIYAETPANSPDDLSDPIVSMVSEPDSPLRTRTPEQLRQNAKQTAVDTANYYATAYPSTSPPPSNNATTPTDNHEYSETDF